MNRSARYRLQLGLLTAQPTACLSLKPVEYTQGYGLDNKALAYDLPEQLRAIWVTFTCSRNRSDTRLVRTQKRYIQGKNGWTFPKIDRWIQHSGFLSFSLQNGALDWRYNSFQDDIC